MFDELLSQFESVLAQAKNTKRPTKSQSQTRVPAESPFFDPTKKFGQVASFGKTQRFKDQPKQQLKTSHIVWEQHKEVPPSEVKKFSFKKSERFEAEKPQYNQTYINPDFKVIKKNTGNNVPVYKVPTGKDLAKSNVSVSTNASESLRGPGIYDVKEESKIKNGAFAKDNRFKQQKVTYEDTPLMINQNQTKKRPPSCTVMKTKTAKTKQTISLEQQEQLRQKLKMIYWKSMPLEVDRLLKNNRAAFIREDYFDFATLRGRHKRAALMMMLDRLNYLRGGYEQNIRTQMDAACAVVYRKSTPKPFKFSEMQPGPDYYYPVDDYIKPNAPNFSFSKEGIKEKPIEYDYRQYEINEQLFKKGGNIIINPLHQELRLSQEQIANIERGPGFYDCIFKLVQKRADIGVVKFQEITQKNDRQNNCVQIKQVNDGIYFPSYNAIDPNVAAPLYRQPANVKPAHIPDKILFPEHWLFYDGDLNKVRAQIAKNVLLAKNMNFKEYQVYKDQMKRFKEYLQIQRRTPEVGQYLVSYKALDPHVPNIQFSKQEEKNLLDPITKPEGQADGDNLILNPKKFEDHLPNIDFKKMEGRGLQPEQDLDQQPKQGDVLLLNPQKPQKHVPNVFFEKQEGRPQDISLQNESGPQGDILILNPKPVQPHIPQVDFSKQAQRQQIQIQQNENEQVNILNPKIEGPTVKGVPFSRLSSVRMVPLLRQKSKIKNSDQ